MNVILFIIVVLLVLALMLYAVQLLPIPGPGTIKQLIMALFVVLAALIIAQRAGVL